MASCSVRSKKHTSAALVIRKAEHQDMLQLTDGYMTAWMLYHLQGDTEAASVFTGENAEILTNSGWQHVEKNK